ncbi:MAG: glycosyltransferase [Streptosporangiales bacterium]|nr:glycosyltransferase [Streptosporangiales bacterium]MBO0892144.1 glycosyltransferase [Acidothermales bacterium]
MRILVVHNRYRSAAPSGENRVVDQESAALTARGHEVERFEYRSDDIDGWPATRKATLPARVVWNPAARRELAATLRRFGPDVAHVHNTFPLLSPAVLYACRDAHVPVVATLHNYKLLCASGDFFRAGAVCHDCAGGSLLPAFRHHCYRGSAAATAPVVAGNVVHRRTWRELVSAYIFISAAQRRLMAGLRVRPDRAFVKPNFVPHVGLPDVPKRRQVAYVGRLDAAKGVPLLLAGWDRYRAVAGDDALRLVVAGDGPLGPDVRRWAEDRPSVDVLGHLTRSQCTDVLAASRAAVLPSQWEETFGLVAVEAMAVGVPSIAAAHGSFPDLVTDGRDGVLFRPGDAAELARAFTAVDRDPDRFAAYGLEARRTYETRFDVATNVDQLLGIYRFAVHNPARLAA